MQEYQKIEFSNWYCEVCGKEAYVHHSMKWMCPVIDDHKLTTVTTTATVPKPVKLPNVGRMVRFNFKSGNNYCGFVKDILDISKVKIHCSFLDNDDGVYLSINDIQSWQYLEAVE